eukprot:CAMPEP_0118974364 /NCGR_PEP_ID=MMETSP1173-20130426/11211_1 /TAXON_ID=1034831 /ORGANISM="Rhizochromulina marina cf, Strain CCMP1243" /LENGTH=324 /DNA_ID=CAMNT_0006924083 /DNA_START=14 /DNA_END=988 /DNA_ORIENTATION=+
MVLVSRAVSQGLRSGFCWGRCASTVAQDVGASEIKTSGSSGCVLVSTDSAGVATVCLNRPDKLNALDMDMFTSIRDAARQLQSMPGVRAVVLKGEGKAFCAGLDIKSVMSNPLNASRLLDRPQGKIANLAQDVAFLWRTLPVPVIAAVHGICFGGGLQIALGADFRFAHPEASLSVMEAKWGLVPDMSGSVLLRELVSMDLAKELTMTARVIDGRQAKDYGLVSHLAEDPEEAARKLALEIAKRSPDAVAGAKQLFNQTWTVPVPEALRIETEIQRKLLIPPLQNTMAAASIGMKLPVQLGFKDRQGHWRGAEESDADAGNPTA